MIFDNKKTELSQDANSIDLIALDLYEMRWTRDGDLRPELPADNIVGCVPKSLLCRSC
jgi:hypothetical protein